jgi:hypothetical protein
MSRKFGLILRFSITCFAIVTLLATENASNSEAKSPQASESPHSHSKTSLEAAIVRPGNPVSTPFRAGEVLEYRVSWSTFATAATATLSIPEQRELSGWHTWHFRAQVNTVSPVRRLFTIDDQFDSYTDVLTLASHQYEMYLDELGKKQTSIFHLAPMGAGEQGPGPFVAVLPGTKDPVDALYSLRAVDWQKASNMNAPVYDGHNLYDMRALREGPESVTVPAGTFEATRVGVHVYDRGQELSRIEFTVWIAQDSAHTPVLMTAQLPFGSLRIELMKPAS